MTHCHRLVGTVRALALAALATVVGGCAETRSFEKTAGGAIVYLDTASEAEKEDARIAVVEALRQGIAAYRLRIGDTVDVFFHFEGEPTKEAYTINVGDELAIAFLYDPDNNLTIKVRPDGHISMPLIGAVHTVGRTADALARSLEKDYRGKLANPVVTVNLTDFSTPLEEFGKVLVGSTEGRNRRFAVGPDGNINLPLLVPIRALDETVQSLEDTVDTAYEAFGLRITVSIIPNTIQGDRIFVFGEVGEPGAQIASAPLTTLMLVAAAGGVLKTGSLENVMVFYVDESMEPRVRTINLKNVIEDVRLEEDMIVPNNSVVYVPPTQLVKAGRFMDQLRRVLMFNGFNVGFSATYIINQSDGSGTTVLGN